MWIFLHFIAAGHSAVLNGAIVGRVKIPCLDWVSALTRGRKGAVRGSLLGEVHNLELSDIDVGGTIKTKRGGQQGDELSNPYVQLGVGGALNVE